MQVSVCVNVHVYVFVYSVQKYCEFIVYLLINYEILPVIQNINLTFCMLVLKPEFFWSCLLERRYSSTLA